MSMRVLITGGAGFIGSRLALALTARGHFVRVLDCLAPQIHGADPTRSPLYRSIAGAVEFQRGSVTSVTDIDEALVGCNAVVHLAAETGTGQSMYAIEHYTAVNVGGTALLLERIANGGFQVDRVVVASSRAVCGEGKYLCRDHGVVFPGPRADRDMARGDFEVHCPICDKPAQWAPTDEDTPVCPSSVYGVTKLTQEHLVLTVGRSLGISAVALRYQNVYGPGQSLSNPYTGILSIFSTRLRRGLGIRIFEDGLESRDFVFVDDVVEATVRSVERSEPTQQVLNVGSGTPTGVLALATTLRELLGADVPLKVTGEYRVGDIRHNVADLTRVRATLDLPAPVPIAEGLRRFVDWVRSEGIQEDRYEQSLQELRAKGLFKVAGAP